MANFFEGVLNALKHPIDEAEWMVKSTRDVLKGDMDLKDVPGSHQEMMNDITVPIFGDNKLSKNSDAVAGAVVGSVLAAPFVGGAMGGSGGGGAPVVDAVGQSPLDAVLAGGGDASEVGSISPKDTSATMKRMGNVIQGMGKDLMGSSAAPQRSAPAFKPSFRPIQTPAFGSDVMAQIASDNYNLQQ